jgi:hypothetical protein
VPKTTFGRFVQGAGLVIGRTLKFLLKCVAVLFGVLAGALILYAVVTVLLPTVLSGVNSALGEIFRSIASTIVAFGVSTFSELVENAVAGGVVGGVIGVLRYQQRSRSKLAERVVDILGEPELLEVRRLGVTTVAVHVFAGMMAGVFLAWAGFPEPGTSRALSVFRDTPIVIWAVGGSGGFGGTGGAGGYGPLAFAPWHLLLWFAVLVLLACALFTSISLVVVTTAVTVLGSTVFSLSRSATLTLAMALVPTLPDHPSRDGLVFMRERVDAALDHDDGRSATIRGAIASGAAIGLITSALLTLWAVISGAGA